MKPILTSVALFRSVNVGLKTMKKKLFLKPCKYLFPFFVVEIKVSS